MPAKSGCVILFLPSLEAWSNLSCIDLVEDQLREAYRQTTLLSGESLCNKFEGLTPELIAQVRKDMDSASEDGLFSIFFFWCRRS